MTTDNKTPAPSPTASKAPTTAKGPRKEYVRAVHGEMRHLFTNELFTATPKKVEIDNFIEVQVEAGKLALGEDA